MLWEIEKIVSKGDYNYVVVKNHPNATKIGHYVLEHRIVMENYLNRLLENGEVVHHKDGNKKNNLVENLELMTNEEHSAMHTRTGVKMVKLKCPNCGIVFINEKRKSFLQKESSYTCCSKKCRGKFSSSIQFRGMTEEKQKSIDENLIEEFFDPNYHISEKKK